MLRCNQTRTQTFKKGDGNLTFFTKGGVNLKKILILRPKVGGVNSVSGEKLHDFEIICPAKGVRLQPPQPPCLGLVISLGCPFFLPRFRLI